MKTVVELDNVYVVMLYYFYNNIIYSSLAARRTTAITRGRYVITELLPT